MSFFEVLDLLFEESNAFEALGFLLAVLAIYFFIFRRRLHSLFDPMLYVLTLSAGATVLLLLMTQHGAVSSGKLAFVVTTLGLFYVGFLTIDSSASRMQRVRPHLSAMPTVSGTTLAILFFANFTVLAVTYVFFGIPLFLESRLAQFSDSGGFGVLGRLTVGLEFSTLVLGFISLRQHSPSRRWGKAILLQFLISALLSGSKGSLITGLFAWYLSQVYFAGSWSPGPKLPRFMVRFLWLVLAAPLIVISVQSAGDTGGPAAVLQRLATRIAAEGDGYAYFLGDDLIDRIARPDWIAPLRQVLVAFRLVPAETAVNPGYEVVAEVLSIESPSTGPNSRLPIYLLYFYGYGGIVIAPLLGMALGWARNRVARSSRMSPTSFALVAAAFLHVSRLEVDPQLTVSGLFGMALALPIFWTAMVLGGERPPRRVRFRQPRADSRAAPHSAPGTDGRAMPSGSTRPAFDA